MYSGKQIQGCWLDQSTEIGSIHCARTKEITCKISKVAQDMFRFAGFISSDLLKNCWLQIHLLRSQCVLMALIDMKTIISGTKVLIYHVCSHKVGMV